MAKKKPEKTETSLSVLGTADKFSGLSGFFKQWAGLGVIGVICGLMAWKITVDDPANRELMMSIVKEERSVSRDETDRSRKHGNDAAKALAEAINKQTAVIDDHQTKVRKNQEDLIHIQGELLKKAK